MKWQRFSVHSIYTGVKRKDDEIQVPCTSALARWHRRTRETCFRSTEHRSAVVTRECPTNAWRVSRWCAAQNLGIYGNLPRRRRRNRPRLRFFEWRPRLAGGGAGGCVRDHTSALQHTLRGCAPTVGRSGGSPGGRQVLVTH